MSQKLFRKGVSEAKRASGFSGVTLAQPMRLWIPTASTASVALAADLFLAIGTYIWRYRVAQAGEPPYRINVLAAAYDKRAMELYRSPHWLSDY